MSTSTLSSYADYTTVYIWSLMFVIGFKLYTQRIDALQYVATNNPLIVYLSCKGNIFLMVLPSIFFYRSKLLYHIRTWIDSSYSMMLLITYHQSSHFLSKPYWVKPVKPFYYHVIEHMTLNILGSLLLLHTTGLWPTIRGKKDYPNYHRSDLSVCENLGMHY